MNYYNENDPKAANWLRELSRGGLIPPGDVDTRSIEEVTPDDVRGYTQCHFFAGIGGWSLALQLAGWPATRPVWTGSCPCQPFSTSGKGLGFDDPRHLWPAFAWLIKNVRPAKVFGEQVASKDGRLWLSRVRVDLEALEYGVGAADLCAAGVGAPHIRQRLYWVADNDRQRPTRRRVGNAFREGPQRYPRHEHDGNEPGRIYSEKVGPATTTSRDSGLADRTSERQERGPSPDGEEGRSGTESGYWYGAVWTPCGDGKQRRIKPGLSPLVDGLPRGVVPSSYQGMAIDADKTAEARVMRISGYGNAIVPELAAEFILAYRGAVGDL